MVCLIANQANLVESAKPEFSHYRLVLEQRYFYFLMEGSFCLIVVSPPITLQENKVLRPSFDSACYNGYNGCNGYNGYNF